ncbi:hypothetical protein [Olivibacter domesticus]|nr:hypothetical protein [Olivibacter domesticus]
MSKARELLVTDNMEANDYQEIKRELERKIANIEIKDQVEFLGGNLNNS